MVDVVRRNSGNHVPPYIAGFAAVLFLNADLLMGFTSKFGLRSTDNEGTLNFARQVCLGRVRDGVLSSVNAPSGLRVDIYPFSGLFDWLRVELAVLFDCSYQSILGASNALVFATWIANYAAVTFLFKVAAPKANRWLLVFLAVSTLLSPQLFGYRILANGANSVWPMALIFGFTIKGLDAVRAPYNAAAYRVTLFRTCVIVLVLASIQASLYAYFGVGLIAALSFFLPLWIVLDRDKIVDGSVAPNGLPWSEYGRALVLALGILSSVVFGVVVGSLQVLRSVATAENFGLLSLTRPSDYSPIYAPLMGPQFLAEFFVESHVSGASFVSPSLLSPPVWLLLIAIIVYQLASYVDVALAFSYAKLALFGWSLLVFWISVIYDVPGFERVRVFFFYVLPSIRGVSHFIPALLLALSALILAYGHGLVVRLSQRLSGSFDLHLDDRYLLRWCGLVLVGVVALAVSWSSLLGSLSGFRERTSLAPLSASFDQQLGGFIPDERLGLVFAHYPDWSYAGDYGFPARFIQTWQLVLGHHVVNGRDLPSNDLGYLPSLEDSEMLLTLADQGVDAVVLHTDLISPEVVDIVTVSADSLGFAWRDLVLGVHPERSPEFVDGRVIWLSR